MTSEEPEGFDFGLFGEELFQDFEEPAIKMGKATAHELISLEKFHKRFEFWPLLNDDCKMNVVKFLDYKNRFNLGICSKSDYEIVNKTPIFVYSIEMDDTETYHYQLENGSFENVVVQIQFHHDYNSGKRFQLIFSQLDDDTQIRWSKYSRNRRSEARELILKSCNYYEEAAKFAEKWMKKCNFGIERIKVEMAKYPIEKSSIKSLPNCKDVRIGADDVEMLKWWLDKVPDELKSLELLTGYDNRENFTIPTDFLENPKIKNTGKFYFYCRAAFTDEQFLNLKATKFSFDCVHITDEAINQFLKNWVNGKCVEKFTEALLWARVERDEATLIKGIDVRPWDHDFEEEARGFCGDFERVCGRGTCFQISSRIDPYYSLTLSISNDRISIYATGKKHEWKGTISTYYRIP